MAAVVRILGRQCLLKQTSALFTRRSTMSTKKLTAYEEMSNYWTKNKALNRPLSPHLSIYKYHLTMVMSISNRVAAVALQAVVLGGSVVILCLPGDFKTNLDKFKNLNLSPLAINSLKYSLAFPFVYHFLISMRHFVWDAGFGYNKMAIIRSNWTILALTALISTALVFGMKPSAM